jgi:tetratricopeptide (TPR) repeat protein
VTHQEPEHGEAWANLSALWLQEGGWREALHAAEQAVKLKRDSWQTWDNYALAASKADAPIACVRGLAEVCRRRLGAAWSSQAWSSLAVWLVCKDPCCCGRAELAPLDRPLHDKISCSRYV